MRPRTRLLLGLAALAACAGPTRAAGIRGDYLEARTADVFTGPCFSNSEIFVTGHQAVLAWGVREGSFQGVRLDGLKVAAAVQANTTFSQDDPARARAVLIVDQKATPEQRDALVALACHLAGDRLQNVAAVRTAPLVLTVEDHADASSDHALHPGWPQAARGAFWAPGLAEIVTRPLDDGDHACGNESIAYAPLSRGVDVRPAFTLGHRFRGEGLGSTWSDAGFRSSFVGHFAD